MTDPSHYIIQGGDSGASRLHILARAFRPGTLALFDQAGIGPGMSILDFGCGSGDVTLELARRVGPAGQVTGIDMDETVLTHGQRAADAANLSIEWRQENVAELADVALFDAVYGRFILSHLVDPADAIRRMRIAARPGGLILVEDIDISRHTYWPPCDAFQRYMELYAATAKLHGVNSSIGPSLAALLIDSGLLDVTVATYSPVFLEGEGKGIARITLENIAESAIESGLTTREEVSWLLARLADHESDPRSIQSTAQVFQCLGRCPEI